MFLVFIFMTKCEDEKKAQYVAFKYMCELWTLRVSCEHYVWAVNIALSIIGTVNMHMNRKQA